MTLFGVFTILVFLPACSAAIDADGDGMDDNFEMQCAQKFKPAVYLHKDEKYGPEHVDKYLKSCQLRQLGSCAARDGVLQSAAQNLTSEVELCLWTTAVTSRYVGCGWKDPDSTIGDASPVAISSRNDPHYLRCLNCAGSKCDGMGAEHDEAKGIHGTDALKDMPFYIHVFPEDANGVKTVQVQYWFFYAFNGPTLTFGTHQGDWEHFSVRLNSQCTERLGYRTFAHGTPPPWTNSSEGVTMEDGVMAVYSAVNSHATYLTEGEHDGGTIITKDYTNKGDRWYPDTLVNPGETTCLGDGRRPMSDQMMFLDFGGEWGSNSAFDGVTDGGLCPSGPHWSYNSDLVSGNPCRGADKGSTAASDVIV